MRARYHRWLGGGLLLVLMVVSSVAQFRGRSSRSTPQRTSDRGGVPVWPVAPTFENDCFTFARIKYTSPIPRRSMVWDTDYPDSDLNLSFRLQQLTAIRVQPEPKVIELTDPELSRYPFIFMSGVGGLEFSADEVIALRKHLLNGGFLMADDFWGESEWESFRREMKRVFPEREPAELPLTHQIFHGVYDLKEKPQIPNIFHAMRYRDTGITWEKEDARVPHYRGLFDDKGRLMALICHNTDLGDGWEEEATDPYYFETFSEPRAYPLGINIIVYAMTH